MKIRRLVPCLCFLTVSLAAVSAAPSTPVSPGFSRPELDGPWKFHLGDYPAWASPAFDDSGWETVDLTPPPGARDADVGLTGYVPGWATRGHRAYAGFAWYRLRLVLPDSERQNLALTGPPAVDSAYQIFAEGRLLGGCGHFSGSTPVAFSVLPRLFPLGGASHQKSMLLAVRVWMGPWGLADPAGGGMRIAPALGPAASIQLLYDRQWRQTFLGYIVEVVEAAAFLLLAFFAWTLRERMAPVLAWLTAALIFTALYRANQAIFFWFQFESVQDFELVSVVLLIPLALAAWTGTWLAVSGRRSRAHLAFLVFLTSLYVLAQFLSRSWFHGDFSAAAVAWIHLLGRSVRWIFLGLTLYLAWFALRRKVPRKLLFLAALVLAAVGQFAAEISTVGVKGIWFPFGVGVSRSQFAYALCALLLSLFFLHLPPAENQSS